MPEAAPTTRVETPSSSLRLVMLTLTLAVRPLGAFLFGRLADDYGRRPVLLVNVLCYSLFGFATAFVNRLPLVFALDLAIGFVLPRFESDVSGRRKDAGPRCSPGGSH